RRVDHSSVVKGVGRRRTGRDDGGRRRRAPDHLPRQARAERRGRRGPAPMTDAVVAGWQARIRAAVVSGTPLRIRGGGTKDFYGEELEGEVLDTTACEGIVDYDPTELVIRVRAGTRLAQVERTLRAEGQMLACEPPRFGEDATIGGFVAAGLSGPRRPY